MRKMLAEFFGTFVLVVFGCGTAMLVGCDSANGSGYLLTALAFGLVIVGMAYSIGNVSGCHINPAVSVGVFLAGKMKFSEFVTYIIAQFAGGIAGAAVLKAAWNMLQLEDKTGAYGANTLINGNVLGSMIVEAILTCVFVLTILGVTDNEKYNSVAGLVIGLTLVLIHIVGIGLTGTSVNPARSLGPALFAKQDFTTIITFIAAPLIGGIIAAFLYKIIAKAKN